MESKLTQMVQMAKVNRNSYNTWLEPYIQCEFEVFKITKKNVYILQDYGKRNRDVVIYDKIKCDKKLFDLFYKPKIELVEKDYWIMYKMYNNSVALNELEIASERKILLDKLLEELKLLKNE